MAAEFSDRPQAKTLCLFDVDGTLTVPRLTVEPDMEAFMKRVREKCVVALVGGSNLVKIQEQMNGRGEKRRED